MMATLSRRDRERLARLVYFISVRDEKRGSRALNELVESEDMEQLQSFRALADNPEHELEFHDRSELEPVRDKAGNPIVQPPISPTSKPIRKELKGLFDRATKMVILVGETTHRSQWVNWEIRTFFDNKKKYPGRTQSRLMAMKLRGQRKATLPKAVQDLGIQVMNWNPGNLSSWLETNPNE